MNPNSTRPAQLPWNKGKIIGSKPPLRTKDVWSIRTKLQVRARIVSLRRRPPCQFEAGC